MQNQTPLNANTPWSLFEAKEVISLLFSHTCYRDHNSVCTSSPGNLSFGVFHPPPPSNHFPPLPLPNYQCSYSHMGAKSHQSLCQKDKDGRGFLWSPGLFHGSFERWGWKKVKISSLSARCWWPPDCWEHNRGHSWRRRRKKPKVFCSPPLNH